MNHEACVESGGERESGGETASDRGQTAEASQLIMFALLQKPSGAGVYI